MAKLYGEIASSALMTFDKSFARANGQPLDSTEVYYSKVAAEEYAAGAGAYIGQKIVVIENGVITHYSIEDTAGTLKELGAKPVGDGLTITITDDGKIALASIPEVEVDDEGNEIPATYNAVLVNGKLTWVKPSSTTVEGLSDLIEALTGRVDTLEGKVGKAAEGENEATGLFKAITDEEARAVLAEASLEAKIGAASKPETAEGAGDAVAATGVYIEIEKKADKTYVDNEIAGLEEAISKLNHFTTKIVTSVDDVQETGILYLIKDESVAGVDKYNEYLYVEGEAVLIGDTTTDLSDYAKTADVVAKTDFETFKTENTTAINAKTTMAEVEAKGYAVASEIESTYAKAEDVYTKTQIDNTIGTPGSPEVKDEEGNTTTEAIPGTGIYSNTYSKAEINALLTEIEGGSTESAASVARDLATYISTNNERVKAIEDEQDTQDIAIAAAQSQADKGVTDAATAQGAAEAAQSTANQVGTDLDAAELKITALETLTNGHTAAINKNTSDIAALVEKVAIEEGKLGTLETTVAAKAEQSALNTLAETVGTNAGNITTLTERISANETAITGLGENKADKTALNDYYTKSQIGDLGDKTVITLIEEAKIAATYNDTEIRDLITGNTNNINTLIGEDTGKSVRIIAADEINSIIGGANDADTIENIKDLIDYVNANGAEVTGMKGDIANNSDDISALQGIIAGIGGEGQPETVMDAIAAAAPAIATTETSGIVKASTAENQVNVDANGLMTVNSINVNKLVQTESEEFILNGGSASVGI